MEFRTLTRRIAAKMGVGGAGAIALAPSARRRASRAAEAGTSGDAPLARTPWRRGLRLAGAPPIDHGGYEVVRDGPRSRPGSRGSATRGVVAVDTETTGLDEMVVGLVGISLATEAGRACYMPVDACQRRGRIDFTSAARIEGQLDEETVLGLLRQVLEDPAILKIGQNMKYDAKIFARRGVAVAPIDDTMLISFALHSGLHGHGMDMLSETYLGHVPIPIKPLLGSGKAARTFDAVPIDEAAPYAAEDADITFRLWEVLKPRLPFARVTRVYETMERPLVPVLAEMEARGVRGRPRASVAHLGRLRPADGGARGGDPPPRRRAVQHRLTEAARARCCSTRWGLPGGKKTATGAWRPGPMCSRNWPPAGPDMSCPRECSTGGSSRS